MDSQKEKPEKIVTRESLTIHDQKFFQGKAAILLPIKKSNKQNWKRLATEVAITRDKISQLKRYIPKKAKAMLVVIEKREITRGVLVSWRE
jgi:hypothetical protein